MVSAEIPAVRTEELHRVSGSCALHRASRRTGWPRYLRVERIFINVGGRAAVPKLPGLYQVAYLTNSSMMAVDFVPRHLILVGGSYVGLEFAQMYRRFGSEVTVVEMAPCLVHHEHPEVSSTIADRRW
jgi:pyruvate/2-oxoglutarate dehydrogenase complex dihydrolipoamide dehydrogenase (E3) component